MTLFLVDHLQGCTPLQPCKSCEAAAFLKARLNTEDFRKLTEMIAESPVLYERAKDEDPVSVLGLCTRSANAIHSEGIKTIGELVQKTGQQLKRFPNFGTHSLAEVEEALRVRGRKLA